jgi:hypothetical protein
VQACLMAFNMVCTYIGIRILVQEHIAYKVWPLVNDWEMLNENAASSSEGGLVYLRYTNHYKNQFDDRMMTVTSCWELTRRYRMSHDHCLRHSRKEEVE